MTNLEKLQHKIADAKIGQKQIFTTRLFDNMHLDTEMNEKHPTTNKPTSQFQRCYSFYCLKGLEQLPEQSITALSNQPYTPETIAKVGQLTNDYEDYRDRQKSYRIATTLAILGTIFALGTSAIVNKSKHKNIERPPQVLAIITAGLGVLNCAKKLQNRQNMKKNTTRELVQNQELKQALSKIHHPILEI